ncbi:hypothetical protein ES695_05545 [Candidatus Atribacteria bacterium 1244-E10-H5-B2]|nr:MAG: hypothetical protein ES695_05545 [Candidatus Atribacteria bacterium 1244-E10-H5-B2]
MAKSRGFRRAESYLSKNKEKREAQLRNLVQYRNRSITLEDKSKLFPLKEYRKDIISFIENEIYLPDKRKKLIQLETWELEILRDCFYQDRPSLILLSLGKKNGKSVFSSFCLLWYLFCGEEYNELYICSNSLDQSSFIIFKNCKSMILKNPELEKRVKIYADHIENRETKTILRCLPASFRSTSGLKPGVICLDEIKNFDTSSLEYFFEELQLAPGLDSPLILITSTVGRQQQGILWDLFERSKQGNDKDNFFFIRQGALANPSSFVTGEYLISQQRKPTMRKNTFDMLHKNLWITEEESYITNEDYLLCLDYGLIKNPGGNLPVYIGLDVGTKDDLTGIVTIGKEGESLFLVDSKTFDPKVTGTLIFDEVKNYILTLSRSYNILSLVYDPYQALSLAQSLEKEGVKTKEMTQSQGNCILFSQNLYSLIKNRKIRFYPDEEIRQNLLNCQTLTSSRGERITKKRADLKIDLAVALAFASFEAVSNKLSGSETRVRWLEDDDSEGDSRGWQTVGGNNGSNSLPERYHQI